LILYNSNKLYNFQTTQRFENRKRKQNKKKDVSSIWAQNSRRTSPARQARPAQPAPLSFSFFLFSFFSLLTTGPHPSESSSTPNRPSLLLWNCHRRLPPFLPEPATAPLDAPLFPLHILSVTPPFPLDFYRQIAEDYSPEFAIAASKISKIR
jgi:hypothetical protein